MQYQAGVQSNRYILLGSMEEKGLPSIRDMYNCTRENYDYNVIRTYESPHSSGPINSKATKKSHYLDEAIRLNCSPGPANTANSQQQWGSKSAFQCKRSQKKTYLDQIDKRQKKLNFPSPNHYQVPLPWPKKRDQLKNVSEKTNFADHSQYESEQTPGPGMYNIRTHLTKGMVDKKWSPHQPIKEKETVAAEVGTYNPCAVNYSTFERIGLKKYTSHPILPHKSSQKGDKSSKENQLPGPGTYSTIAHWAGKQPPKKDQTNYMKYLSKGPTAGVYHG